MSKTVKINFEGKETISQLATVIHIGSKKYYFMPYWFEETDKENVFIIHPLEKKLPKDLLDVIKLDRDKPMAEPTNEYLRFPREDDIHFKKADGTMGTIKPGDPDYPGVTFAIKKP